MIVWAVETLVATTLLMVLVLMIRTPVRRSFGPGVAYALWAIPVLRMILPPLPEAWRGSALPTMPVPEDITFYLGAPVATLPAEPASGIGWPVWLLGLWIAGAVGFALYHLIAHGRFCARVQRTARRSEIVASGNVRVIETDAAAGPLAFGVLRKFVAFPRDFAERYDPLERDLALAHELGHHARGDLIANWIALAMLALHWFNPIAWRAFRAFRADQEMACDALVLAGRARELRAAYGRAIVKSAHGGAVSAACHLHTINELKGRLKMLTKHEKISARKRLAGGSAIGAILLTGMVMTASGTQAADTVRTKVEDATGVDLASIELPPLPALPAAPTAQDLPPVPEAPPAPPVPPAGANKKRVHIVTRDKDGTVREYTGDSEDSLVMIQRDGKTGTFTTKDGKTLTFNGAGSVMSPENAERLARIRIDMKDMPQISSRKCDDSDAPGSTVINRKDGDKKVTIICTNRIERVAMNAQRDAMKAQREAMAVHGIAMREHNNALFIQRSAERSALDGLRSARRSIDGNTAMSAEAKAGALQGIDEAIRELEAKKD
ncbi:M56 family metallopeptidase [uncultured Sphingomonas sp.]|uniref:M56 family metallopeptidase n=1 Tax=uncultured Sphingomonas sp. TaxID=158754 RepID=UPI0025DF26F7|nr:M56 family metallopeptidase [uncultured Sphingomonas sp.]